MHFSSSVPLASVGPIRWQLLVAIAVQSL